MDAREVKAVAEAGRKKLSRCYFDLVVAEIDRLQKDEINFPLEVFYLNLMRQFSVPRKERGVFTNVLFYEVKPYYEKQGWVVELVGICYRTEGRSLSFRPKDWQL